MAFKDWTQPQLEVARATQIITTGLALPIRILRLCLLTQMVESSLKGAVPYADQPGFMGAYQQSNDWVPKAVIGTKLDPRATLAGGTFLFVFGGYHGQNGVVDVPWLTNADSATCQAVQESDHPAAYHNVGPDCDAIMAYLGVGK